MRHHRLVQSRIVRFQPPLVDVIFVKIVISHSIFCTTSTTVLLLVYIYEFPPCTILLLKMKFMINVFISLAVRLIVFMF
jgi:hypothetical protein